MSDLDSTKGNPTIQLTTRVPKDALANARLARTRETQGQLQSLDWQTFVTWELSGKSE